MKLHQYIFGLCKFPLDALMVICAFFIARDIRISTDLIPWVQLPSRTLELPYLLALGVISYLFLALIFSFQKLYAITKQLSIIEEIFTIIRSIIVTFFVLVGFLYLFNGFPYETLLIPRLILIYAFLLAMIGIICERMLLRVIERFCLRNNWFKKRKILLVMLHGETLIERSFQNEHTVQIIGYISPFPQESTFIYRGTIGDHIQIHTDHKIDEMIVLSHDLPFEMRKTLFEFCQIHGITYRYVGNLYEVSKNNAHIDFIGRVPFIEIRTIGLTAWGRIIKRSFDLVVGVILGILLIPIWIAVSAIIMIESRGGPFYVSTRVGQGGKTFRLIKFRSMVRDAESLKETLENERGDGPLFKKKNDPRITPFGRWIRRWSIDELPNIFNVIRGEMSFMGPRPHLPEEVDRYVEKQRQVLTIKPGITGMAQVYGRDKNSFEREVELDLFYIENWSLLLDTKILFLTFRAVFQGK